MENDFVDLVSRYTNKNANQITPNNKKVKILKIDKTLPQIIVPANKVKMFIDWWNSDIRFEQFIPHTFNKGYMVIENIADRFEPLDNYKDLIKSSAKMLNTTYRAIENQFKDFLEVTRYITLYFTFTAENAMFVEVYGSDNKIISNMSFTVGKTDKPENEIDLNKKLSFNDTGFDGVLNELNFLHLSILVSCLWYIATTTKSTKYIYEKKIPTVINRSKGIVQVSDTKTINTPIYDMQKIKVVKVETLSTRKKGWTYSHSFEVHGHYRHYKDGKVIFVQPYIKGKNKEFKAQQIILDPH